MAEIDLASDLRAVKSPSRPAVEASLIVLG